MIKFLLRVWLRAYGTVLVPPPPSPSRGGDLEAVTPLRDPDRLPGEVAERSHAHPQRRKREGKAGIFADRTAPDTAHNRNCIRVGHHGISSSGVLVGVIPTTEGHVYTGLNDCRQLTCPSVVEMNNYCNFVNEPLNKFLGLTLAYYVIFVK
jgi:hypothetical protein